TAGSAAAVASAVGSTTTAADPVRPDWLCGVPEAPRGGVVRSDDPMVQVVALPTVEQLDEDDAAEDEAAEDAGHTGGAAVTWALGYRAGYETGHDDGHRAGYEDGLRLGLEQATAEAVARYDVVLGE